MLWLVGTVAAIIILVRYFPGIPSYDTRTPEVKYQDCLWLAEKVGGDATQIKCVEDFLKTRDE